MEKDALSRYFLICSPARSSDGSTFDMIVDIDRDRIELIADGGNGTISLDLACAADFAQTIHKLVNSKEFQSALQEKISEHTGRVYTEDRPAS